MERELQTPEHLSEVQDENGTDLSLLRQNLKRSVQERFERLEQQQEQIRGLRGISRQA